jgi:hypothetical protein
VPRIGVDGRSLRAWSMNLARRKTTGRRKNSNRSVDRVIAQPLSAS